MVSLNEILKLVFVVVACWFLVVLVTVPKTDCEACQFEYKGDVIDGYDAYRIFEDACIDYAKPWDSFELPDFSNITITNDDEIIIVMSNTSPQILDKEDMAELRWGDTNENPHAARSTE